MFLLPGGTLHSSSEWKNQDHSRITVAFNLAHLPKPGFEWELLLNETEVADLVKQRQGARDINVLPEYRSDTSAPALWSDQAPESGFHTRPETDLKGDSEAPGQA